MLCLGGADNQDVYPETSGMLLWLLIHNYYDVICRNNEQS